MLNIIKTSEILIKTKPITQNSAFYKNRRVLKDSARKYRALFFNQLMSDKNQKALSDINSVFNKQKHCLKFEFLWYQPHSILFTKDSYLSRRSMDVDNVIKLPTDFICNDKYNTEWLHKRDTREMKHYSIESLSNLNIDDQFIISTTSMKWLSLDDTYQLRLLISLCNLPI